MSNFKRYYQDKNIVFITIVTYNRQQILVKNIELLRQSFKNVKYNYEIIAGIVLPDHLHILIQTDEASDYSKIISSFKSNFSRLLPKNINQTEAQLDRREKGFGKENTMTILLEMIWILINIWIIFITIP